MSKQYRNTAWNWDENEILSISERKVHTLISNNTIFSDKEEDWTLSDTLSLPELFEKHKKGYFISSGYREEWNLQEHGYGSGYTYFLGIVVKNWANFSVPPQNIEDYLEYLPEDLINQIAWISEIPESTNEHKKFIVIFNFAKIISGRVIQEAYSYISQIPGAEEGYKDKIPRIIYPTKETKWIGGTIDEKTCEQIIGEARKTSFILKPDIIQEKPIDPRISESPKLDIEKGEISGLINKKYPISDPKDKDVIFENSGYFHAKNSMNWKQCSMTLKEWFMELNKGHHIAPGYFEYINDEESRRSTKALQYTHLILLDVDEWKESNINPPETIQEWYKSLPKSVRAWITWVGESASSRSERKPELRLRVAIAFEKPIPKDHFLAIAEYLHKYIPGTALRVAKDKVRLSYGNAREECKNAWCGGYLSEETINYIIDEFNKRKEKENRENNVRREFLREQKQKRKNNQNSEDIAPWDAFNLEAENYLTSLGYTKLERISASGWINYSRPDGDKGKPSVGARLSKDQTWRISSFSTSISWPSTDSTISLLEFYCWNEYQLDIIGGIDGPNTTNFKEAMQRLSDDGFGSWGKKDFDESYKKAIKEYQPEIPTDPNKDVINDDEEKPAYWNIEKNTLKHRYILNRNYYTEPKGNPEALEIAQKYSICWLDGPPGVAKTTFQLAHARLLPEDEKKLVAGPRKILSENLSYYLNDELKYTGLKDQNEAVSMPVKYIHGDVRINKNWQIPLHMLTSTIHSMLRAIRILNQKGIEDIHLALDEIDFIIQAFYSPQLYGKAQEILDEISEYASRNTVFLTGATASTGLILEFVKALNLTPDDICQISINREAKKGGTLKFAKVKVKEIIDTIANAIDTLPKKTKIFVGFADKEYAKTLKEHPKIKARGKVQMVTSENSQDKEVKKLLTESTLEEMNIDVLIVSPSVDVGVNLFGEDTQVIIVRAATFGAPVKTSWQQARRVRNTKRPIWYISSEIDWTKSLSFEELRLAKQQKVTDNFIYYISNPRETSGVEDSGIFAELNASGQKAGKILRNLKLEDLLEKDYLNLAQKSLLQSTLNRSCLEARVEWEAEQELLFEEEFIEYHAKREGMNFEIWEPELPTEEEVKATSTASSARKKAEREKHMEAVVTSLVEHDFTSLEAIENKRKDAEYKENEYEIAIDVNNRMQKTGIPDILLNTDIVREKEVQRALEMVSSNIEPTDFQRKYEIYEALNNPDKANKRFYYKATKDLNKAICRPIQARIMEYIDSNLSYMGSDYLEVFYKEISHLARQKIAVTSKGVENIYTLADAIFIHFPDKLRSYRRMRRYGTTEEKALYTIFNKLLKQYLHKCIAIVGEKGKKREIQNMNNIELYIKLFEEVSEAEVYYQENEHNVSEIVHVEENDRLSINKDINIEIEESYSGDKLEDSIEF